MADRTPNQTLAGLYVFDEDRLAKLAELREAGIEPYPNGLPVPEPLAVALTAGGDLPDEALQALGRVFTVAGRVRFKNEMGRAGFARIQDQSGRLQLYVRLNDVDELAWTTWRRLDLGDWVWARGTLMRTRAGELSLHVVELRLYSKCIESLPDKHKGFGDPELRHRMRYLDLAVNEEVRATFLARSRVVSLLRRFFEDRGFLEVETPMMQPLAGGAAARPFVTHHNALDIDLYLRVAPELYLKRLVVGGFERVFEVNKNFRNEGVSQKHNPEFTMLEFYWAHHTVNDLMDLTEELVVHLADAVCGTRSLEWRGMTIDLAPPWRRAAFDELVAQAAGVTDPWDVEALRAAWVTRFGAPADPSTLPTTPGRWFEWWFDAVIEAQLVAPTFVTRFPTEISPLSRRNDREPHVSDRFELIVGGWELANGFSELNDPVDQALRFADQAAAKAAGDLDAMFFDADYVRALSYGMPPTAGEGIGIDRLVMLLTGQQSIREVILFPARKPADGSGVGGSDPGGEGSPG